MNKPMENISLTNRALELLEEFMNKTGGGIYRIDNLSSDIDANNAVADIGVCFNFAQLREYISHNREANNGGN